MPQSGRSRLFAVVAGLLLAAAALPAVGWGAWSAPVTLSGFGDKAVNPHAGVDGAGNSIVAWEANEANFRIEARTVSAAGDLGPIQFVSPAGQDAANASVAVSGAGDGILAWERSDSANVRIQARTFSTAGILGPVTTLSAAGYDAAAPQVGIDRNGNAVVDWTLDVDPSDPDCCGQAQVRSFSSAGVAGPLRVLSAPAENAWSPSVAMDPSGRAVFAWTDYQVTKMRIYARARSASGTLKPEQQLSAFPIIGDFPTGVGVGIDKTGDAVFVWNTNFDGTSADCCSRAKTRARAADGTLSPIRTLSAAGQNVGDPPNVAVDQDGDAVFAWHRFDGTSSGCCLRVQARARASNGALSSIQTLSAGGRNAQAPTLAIDASGRAVIAWQRSDGANKRLQAVTRSPGGSLGSVRTISPAGSDAGATSVASNASGSSAIAFELSDGTNTRIKGSFGP